MHVERSFEDVRRAEGIRRGRFFRPQQSSQIPTADRRITASSDACKTVLKTKIDRTEMFSRRKFYVEKNCVGDRADVRT